MKINEILWKQPQDRFQDEEKNNYLYRLVWYVVFIETVLIIILKVDNECITNTSRLGYEMFVTNHWKGIFFIVRSLIIILL